MLSDKFHPDTSERHGSGMPRIQTAESRCFCIKWEHVGCHFVWARNEKSFEVGTPGHAAMVSDMLHPDTSDRHGSGMPRIRPAESRRFDAKWEHLACHFVWARNKKSFDLGTPEHTAMLSDTFHMDTSDWHGSGMPRTRTTESGCFGTKWEHVHYHFV
jgi:hypothetical protein